MAFPTPHVVNVQRESWTDDKEGGDTQAWATVMSAVRCFVQPKAGRRTERYAGQDVEVTHSVYTPRGGIQRDDRIKFGGRYLRVVYARRMDERQGYYHLGCLEVEHGS